MRIFKNILAAAALGVTAFTLSHALADEPVFGGTLIYLDKQVHSNLYVPAAGFYSNGGVLGQITDRLTWQNPETLEIEPWIAESWEINEDATIYTFKIRHGVTFSDGTPLDAQAIARNYDTYGLGNEALRQPVSEVINNYQRSEVLDPLTVRFYFSRPSPGFLQGTSVLGSGLVSLKTLALPFDQTGDATKIIGSGPFVVESENLGKELVLKVREDYAWAPQKFAHQGRAYLDAIRFLTVPEDNVRIGALIAGQAHFIRYLEAYDEERVAAAGLTIYAPSTRGVNNNIVFRPDNELVSDRQVRRALLHATNRKAIVEALYSPNYPAATSVVARTAVGYVDQSDKLRFDPTLAETLLDEAGWKKGADGIREKGSHKLELNVIEAVNQPRNKAMLQQISQQWAQIGVKLNVRPWDATAYVVDNLDPQKTPLSPAMVGRADADVVKSNFHPKNRDALRQLGGMSDKIKSFHDEKLNTLLEDVASQPEHEERIALLRQALEHLIDAAYVIPIFEEPQVYGGAPHVKGIGFEAVGRPFFYNTYIDNKTN